MTSPQPPEKPTGRPTNRPSQNTREFADFRHGIEEAARKPAPGIPRADLSATLVALVIAIACAFAPWTSYPLRDGSLVTDIGIRGDGLLTVLFALGAIGILAVAMRRKAGDASTLILIALGLCIAALIAPALRALDPGIYQESASGYTVAISREWGLIGCLVMTLVATINTFRIWRFTDYY